MSNLVKAANRADIAPGEAKCVEIAGKAIAVFNVGGEFFALGNTCPHRGGPLGEGTLQQHTVTCPWHGWQFDCRTGQSISSPGKAVESYRVQVEQEDVLIDLG